MVNTQLPENFFRRGWRIICLFDDSDLYELARLDMVDLRKIHQCDKLV